MPYGIIYLPTIEQVGKPTLRKKRIRNVKMNKRLCTDSSHAGAGQAWLVSFEAAVAGPDTKMRGYESLRDTRILISGAASEDSATAP